MAICRYEFSRCFLIFFSVGQYPAGRCAIFRAFLPNRCRSPRPSACCNRGLQTPRNPCWRFCKGRCQLTDFREADILHNLLFYLALVHIGGITLSDLFHIDEVEQVIVLKHHYGFAGEGRIGYGAGKIVGKSVLIFKGVLSNYLFETVS